MDSVLNILPDGTGLAHLRFWGGCGKARYTMRHGSFRIRDRVSKRIPLSPVESEEGPMLVDSEKKYVVTLELSQSGSVTRIGFRQRKGEPFTRFWIGLPARPDEGIFGCGETFSEFNLKGNTVRIWVAEHQNISRIARKIVRNAFLKPHPHRKLPFAKYETYYAQPTFTSSEKYFIHIDSDTYMEFTFSEAEHLLYMHALPKAFYIGRESTFEALSASLSSILGKQPLPPKWINDGLIIAVQGGTEAVKKKVQTALNAGIPLAGVWSQDWCGARITLFGKQVMWNWEHDPELYPNLKGMMAQLKEKGIRFLGYINPFIALEGKLYHHATARGYCVKDKKGRDYLATTTTFPAAMIDFTNPAAYDWYKEVIKEKLIDFGLDGWMADFGEYMPVDAQLFCSEDNVQTHNRWPAIWAALNREALEEKGCQDEVFFFTRAGHIGTVQNSMMMWSGDQHVDWSEDDGLPSAITAALSLAMSGYGIVHSDIGGYMTMPKCCRNPELLIRWAEFAAFSPVMRCHEGNRPGNNAQFDCNEETLEHLARITRVHVMLKDYINDCIMKNHQAGTPVMRPLFYHYDEKALWEIKYAYLLGRDLACYPVVVQGQTVKELYLPEDEWVHLFTGKEYRGGRCSVSCSIGCPPVFYRKASRYKKLFEEVNKFHDAIEAKGTEGSGPRAKDLAFD